MSGTPYADAADIYRQRGWWPIPVDGKAFPEKGTTGRDGVVTDEQVETWKRARASRNIAIRHVETVAIDVDEHDEKHGAASFATWQERLGVLPPTWTSTARGKRSPSRQHLYRVPEGVRLRGRLDADLPDVEVCHRGHRYSVVWPSVHPTTGKRYRWFDPDGNPIDGPPALDDLPDLPEAHLDALTAPERGERVEGDHLDGAALLASLPTGLPCSHVEAALDRAVAADERDHISHDEARDRLFELLRLGLAGHAGAADAVKEVLRRWRAYLERERGRNGREADRALEGSAQEAQARPIEPGSGCTDLAPFLPGTPATPLTRKAARADYAQVLDLLAAAPAHRVRGLLAQQGFRAGQLLDVLGLEQSEAASALFEAAARGDRLEGHSRDAVREIREALEDGARRSRPRKKKTKESSVPKTIEGPSDPLAWIDELPEDLRDEVLNADPDRQAALKSALAREWARVRVAKASAGMEPLAPLKVQTAHDLAEATPETPWLVEGLIAKGTNTNVVAYAKTGKTTFMLNLVRSALTGETFLGRFEVRRLTGPVVWLDYENDPGMLAGWFRAQRVSPAVARRLHVVSLRGEPNPFRSEAARAQLEELIASVGGELVVIDPLSAAMKGLGLNPDREARVFLEDARQLVQAAGATELLVAVHSGHPSKDQPATRARGDSGIEDWADETIRLSRDGQGADAARYVSADGRYGDLPKDRLVLDPVEKRLSLAGSGYAISARVEKVDQLVEPILAAVAVQGGMTVGMLEDTLRGQGIPFRKGEPSAAVKRLEAEARLVTKRDGKRVHLHLAGATLPPAFQDAS